MFTITMFLSSSYDKHNNYAIITIAILLGFLHVVVVVNSFITINNNYAADYNNNGGITTATIIVNTSYKTAYFTATTLLRCSSSSNNNNHDEYIENGENKYYRSISDVVGGLHGGKYQFDNNDGVVAVHDDNDNDDAFSGIGSYSFNNMEEEEEELLPNWAVKMEPNFSIYKELTVPTNSNLMDGMIYFSSIIIQNDERTWEKFYVKMHVIINKNKTNDNDNTATTNNNTTNNNITVQPKSGFLAPRGGTRNVCNANKPYSDKATIRIIQQQNNKNKKQVVTTTEDNIINNDDDDDDDDDEIWLVVGTEEEKWSYKLILE
jgi:hypothetical protein